MRKRIVTTLIPILILILSACAPVDKLLEPFVPETDNAVPGRMVTAMQITSYPEDTSLSKRFTSTEALTNILQMLRNMDNDKIVEENPHTDQEQSCFTVTVVYANGYEESYCLLENQYLQNPDGSWRIVTYDDVTDLAQFIRNTSNDEA